MKFEYTEDGTLVIDDGACVIAQLPTGDYFFGIGEGMSAKTASGTLSGMVQNGTPENDEITYDTYPYMTSDRYMTVEDSTARALNRIYYDIWHGFTSQQIGDVSMLRSAIRRIIANGMGRHATYATAGGIRKGYQQGNYWGVPLAYVMKGFAEGVITLEDRETVTWENFHNSSQ